MKGKKIGPGVRTHTNGITDEGNFVDGRLQGSGTRTRPGEAPKKAMFKDD